MLRHLSLIIIAALGLIILPSSDGAKFTKGEQVVPFTPEFKPGDYVWHPEISPAGPVVVIVSLPDQVMYVYRNGVRIGRSTVSTGTEGHRTPTGVFTVLQKKVDHESSIYKGAKMPNMQRLTWTGIAMHAGQLPGYPASHGCVRLPEDFAAKLYTITKLGTTVVIADNKSSPINTTKPGLIFSTVTGETFITPAGFTWTPEKSPDGPVSIIVSTRDRTGYVYRNGVEIGRAEVRGIERISGTHIYAALETVGVDGKRNWISKASVGGRAPNLSDLANKVKIAPEFLSHARALITPGTTLILTDAPVSDKTKSGPGFNILTAAQKK
jgi:L,D-transpeptidase catalytic domain